MSLFSNFLETNYNQHKKIVTIYFQQNTILKRGKCYKVIKTNLFPIIIVIIKVFSYESTTYVPFKLSKENNNKENKSIRNSYFGTS